MTDPVPDPLEALLAAALAIHDQQGAAALAAFLAAHPAERPGLERALVRCRQMGLLGASPEPRDFPTRLGEFRLLHRLGSGGMGVVYAAVQDSLDREVALKVVRPELLFFEGARERFRREIEAVARLSHPAVVPVLASGEQDGIPWYAMERLHGRTAQEVCNALAGRDPATLRAADLHTLLGMPSTAGAAATHWWQVCVQIAHTVATGVQHAHRRGIVHRDIKPANVMLTGDGRTVLLDFGVAMLGGGREFTRTGQAPGSPAFMSPEQLRGDAVDERTDVYSLGATLWQLLALVPPFRGDTDLLRIHAGELPALKSHNRDVPRELVIVVHQAMDRDRERRYATVEALAADLTAVLQRRPIRARRLVLPLRAWRWCQRHRAVATAAATLLVLLLSLPGVFAWRERATNAELSLAIGEARDSLDAALDAIDRMLVTLASERLRFVPAAAVVTRQALDQACAMYRELRARHPQHARLRRDTSTGLNRLAAAVLQAGDRAAAQALYEEGLAVLGDGPLDDPDLLDARANGRLNLARLHQQFGEADALQRHLDAAAADYAGLAEHANWRGAAHFGLAHVSLLRCDLAAAQRDATVRRQLLETCVAQNREAVRLQPQQPQYLAALVVNLDNLATDHAQQQRHSEALEALAEALEQLAGMPPDARVWPVPKLLQAAVLETRGNLWLQQRDARAVDDLTACVALREAVLREHPEDVDLQCRLGGALHNLARTDCESTATDAQLQRALERLDRAIGLERDVLEQTPGYERARLHLMLHLRLRGNCLMRLQRRDELVEVAAELRQDVRNANHLRATARFWLRAAELLGDGGATPELRAHYEEQALDALLAAERAGWRHRSTLDEAVYQPLERLPGFVALRERLQAAQPGR